MQTTTAKKTPPAPRIVRRECCTCDECTSGARNNYFTGKRLTADTFRVEQRYLLDRRHLLNRAIHGWGVVYGYPVEMAAVDQHCPGAEKGQLRIGEGLALDKVGRELVQTGPVILTSDSVYLKESLDKNLIPPIPGTWSPKGMYEGYQHIRQIRDTEGAQVFIAHDPELFKATKHAPDFYD